MHRWRKSKRGPDYRWLRQNSWDDPGRWQHSLGQRFRAGAEVNTSTAQTFPQFVRGGSEALAEFAVEIRDVAEAAGKGDVDDFSLRGTRARKQATGIPEPFF